MVWVFLSFIKIIIQLYYLLYFSYLWFSFILVCLVLNLLFYISLYVFNASFMWKLVSFTVFWKFSGCISGHLLSVHLLTFILYLSWIICFVCIYCIILPILHESYSIMFFISLLLCYSLANFLRWVFLFTKCIFKYCLSSTI